jgi:nitroreductase
MQEPHHGNLFRALPTPPRIGYPLGLMNTTDETISPDHLTERLAWRYATKQFDPRHKIDGPTWHALEEALRLSPSGGGLQPWKFVVVTDPAVRERLVPASYGQIQVRDASHLVVFTVKADFNEADIDAHVQKTARVRGIPTDSLAAFRGMLVGGIVKAKDPIARLGWAARQSYLALGTLLTGAALLGVDAAPMEGFDPAQYDKILGLKEKGLTTTVICALGYRMETDPYAALPKVRFDHDDVFLHV